MFLLRKIVSRFFFPLPLSLEFVFVGLFLLWFTRRQRAGKALVTCGALLLVGLSNTFTSDALLRPLEHQYPPLAVGHIGPVAPDVTFITVLGGWADHDPNVPITSHISPDLMVRLIEGVALQREIPGSKLILSGGNDSAEGMTKMAEALGVSAEDILRLAEPRDTEEESQQIAPYRGFPSIHSGDLGLTHAARHGTLQEKGFAADRRPHGLPRTPPSGGTRRSRSRWL